MGCQQSSLAHAIRQALTNCKDGRPDFRERQQGAVCCTLCCKHELIKLTDGAGSPGGARSHSPDRVGPSVARTFARTYLLYPVRACVHVCVRARLAS